MKYLIALAISSITLTSCQKETSIENGGTISTAKINFIYKFDSTQVRLNGLGQPAVIPVGNAAQSPRFKLLSAHYLEITKDPFTALGAGTVLFRAPEVTIGGANAIDFTKMNPKANGEVFLSVPINSFAAGTYNWLRVSIAYQKYDITVNGLGVSTNATVSSFIGFRTYIPSFVIKDSTVTLNANKDQGYWAVEGNFAGFGLVRSGQAPPGATTVPNPLFATSPIPSGSCVVTGQFGAPLVITGTETADINIEVSFSINKSFEWKDFDANGTFDPLTGDSVVDMGIRGMLTRRL
jgi:hypothetical protein